MSAKELGQILRGEVNALDVAADPLFNGQLHPSLGFGRFELWPALRAALDALGAALADAAARDVEALDEDAAVARWLALCERGALAFLRNVLLASRAGCCPAFEWAQRARNGDGSLKKRNSSREEADETDEKREGPGRRRVNTGQETRRAKAEFMQLAGGEASSRSGASARTVPAARARPPQPNTRGAIGEEDELYCV